MAVAERKAPIRLEGVQKLASDPGELIWLSASAGTGKTQVLGSRVLRLLLGGARPETILCLTFTKAGAAEMANRIQSTLARWVQMKGPDLAAHLLALGERATPETIARARTLFAEVLDSPGGGLRILTIHAFCQTLLAGFPSEAGLTPGFRPIEGREEAALARRTLGDLLEAAERGGDLGLIAAVETLSRRLGEGGAEAYLMRCARDPEAMETLGPGVDAKVRRALAVPDGDIEAAIAQGCADTAFAVETVRAVAAANAAWGTATGRTAADRCAAFLAADPAARAALLDDLALVVLTTKGEPRAVSAKLAALAPDYADHAGRLAEACTALLDLRRRAELARLLGAGLRAGQAFATAYARAKRAAGVLDFDDLIRHAGRLLYMPGMGDWVRYKLDRATDHILVDEAQDTNARQWAIVRALAAEFFAGEGARPESRLPRTLFTVGDFKQAIFGFQGTDPEAFSAAGFLFERDAGEAGRALHRLSLDTSFRSSPPVLALVDRLLEDVGPEGLGLDEPANPHVSAYPRRGGRVTLWRPVSMERNGEGEDSEEGWIDDATRAFAAKLAHQIRLWLDDPFPVESRGRPLRPEDILILVRRRGELASLLVARLHEEGVPVAGVDRLRLTAPLAVRDLLSVIRFALQPGDDLSLASLLVSPLFGLTQEDLYALGFGRKGSLWSALQRDARFAEAAAGLGAVLASADFTTPYVFLESLLSGPLDGRRKLLARLGEEARDPIEELLNAALQFESAETPSLQRFLDWFDRGEVDITRDAAAPADAVRVMTVHGAKGLQAPVVILADATADPDASRTGVVHWGLEEELSVPVFRPRKEELAGGLADDLAAAERRERAEHWRLLYVAATRAEERLIIGGALGVRARGEPPRESWYQALDRAMEGLGAPWDADAHWSGARHYSGEIEARPLAPARARMALGPPREPAWLRVAAPVEARPPRPLAPSSLGRDETASPPPSTPAMRDAALRGRLLHGLFERLPALAPEIREAAALRWLEQAAGVEDAGLRARLAGDACAILADPRFAALFRPDALAEAPIAAVVGEQVVAGTVDRLLVDADRVLVVDFKTGTRVPATAEAAPVEHLRQMAAYIAALEVVFPGRRVEAALLYTAGPRLLALPKPVIEAHKPGLAGVEQIHSGIR